LRARPAASALLVACATCAPPAAAQLSGDIAVVSDYRYRGVSLSGNRPAVQAGLSFDARNGLYAGVFASTLDAAFIESHALVQAYAGFAQRSGEAAWDAGASVTLFPQEGDYNYGEVHAGLSWEKWSAALHFAPEYFGRRVRTLYAETNAAWPQDWTLPWPAGVRTSLVAHAGVLFARSTGEYLSESRNRRVDAKAGIAFDARWAKLELAWVAGDTPIAVYPVRRDSRRSAFVATLSRAF
jgi:uncharacterized protein (TIGR02001 family)